MANAPKPSKDEGHEEKPVELAKQAQEKVKQVCNYACSLNSDTIAYILLTIGLLFFFFVSPLFGGAIVGIVFGVYFADQITLGIIGIRGYFSREQLARTIIFFGFVAVLIYALPTLFLGALAAVGIVALTGCDMRGKKTK
jgi:membrane-bound ClpP family serine protease